MRAGVSACARRGGAAGIVVVKGIVVKGIVVVKGIIVVKGIVVIVGGGDNIVMVAEVASDVAEQLNSPQG